MAGLFITFEGVEGAGKSLQARLLHEALAASGVDATLTREPGGTRISEMVREILLSNDNAEMSPVTEACLYAAARAQHTDVLIRPRLAAGGVVICDRYLDSSVAYQGFGRGLGMETVLEINRAAVSGAVPDITFLISLDPEEGMRRKSGDRLDRLESEGMEFHRAVARGFVAIAEAAPERVRVVDGTLPSGDIHGIILSEITDRLYHN